MKTDMKDLAPGRRPEVADVVGRLGGNARGRAHLGRDLKSHVVGHRWCGDRVNFNFFFYRIYERKNEKKA